MILSDPCVDVLWEVWFHAMPHLVENKVKTFHQKIGKILKPPSEVVSNLPGFVLDSCVRLKPTETANHDVIAPPLDLLANGS